MTKLRKHAAAIALAGLLALFGTACATEDDGGTETETEAGVETSEPAEAAS